MLFTSAGVTCIKSDIDLAVCNTIDVYSSVIMPLSTL